MTDTKPKKQLPHLVFGGEIEDLAGTAFQAEWALATVDNAHMRYFIVHLHRLLDPGAA